MEKRDVTALSALQNLAESLKAWNALQTEKARLTSQISAVLRRHFPAPKGTLAQAG
ncbi:hypothetical protein [Geothrix sp. 21YS21S-2]|uniref:hypothetical protein n=1 Tax=Geothrix sp. 21YS21S-2 TaxID=3068893 RepID=UPI0027B89EAA|nr:hypothetical protein [Geothrix sp. 21YS21S-2]